MPSRAVFVLLISSIKITASWQQGSVFTEQQQQPYNNCTTSLISMSLLDSSPMHH